MPLIRLGTMAINPAVVAFIHELEGGAVRVGFSVVGMRTVCFHGTDAQRLRVWIERLPNGLPPDGPTVPAPEDPTGYSGGTIGRPGGDVDQAAG